MTDLISRADAMAEFREWVKRANKNGETPTWNDAVSLIGSLPSADAVCREDTVTLNSPISIQAVQGEWIWRTDIPIGDGRTSAEYICSNCGKDYWHGNVFNYCPSCGARMKGGDDE